MCAALTSIISAVVGMAGGIVLLSAMTFFLALETIVPIHGVVQLVSNGTRVAHLRKNVVSAIFVPNIVGISVGTYISTQVILRISNREIFYFLVAALIFYVLFKPKNLPPLKIPYYAFGFLGVLVGLLNPLIGATGPLMAPFYLRDDLSKEEIVATKASTQTFGHLLKIPAFVYLGFDYHQHALLITCMCFAVILGTHFGVGLLRGIKDETFRFIFRAALFIAACRVLFKAILSLA